MEEIVNNVVAYAAVIGPAITAVFSIIIAVALNIKKVKSVTLDSTSKLTRHEKKLTGVEITNTEMKTKVDEMCDKTDEVIKQNEELRKELTSVNERLVKTCSDLEKDRRELNTIKNQLREKLKGE